MTDNSIYEDKKKKREMPFLARFSNKQPISSNEDPIRKPETIITAVDRETTDDR